MPIRIMSFRWRAPVASLFGLMLLACFQHGKSLVHLSPAAIGRSPSRRSQHCLLGAEKAAQPLGNVAAASPTPSTPSLGLTPVDFVAECELPTQVGAFRLRAYRAGGTEPTVVVKGDVSGSDVLVRVHDQCFTSEVLGSQRCDCKMQLDASFAELETEGRGIIIYLQQEGRGIGLANKIAAYSLQDGANGLDTVDANHQLGFSDELRTYGCVPGLLDDLGVKSVKLLTNNPFKVAALESLGVKVSQRLPLVVAATKDARAYLRTKALRMAHVLPPESYATAAEANAAAEAIAAADSLAAAAEALAHAGGGGGSAPSETPGASSQSTINDAKADGAAETFVNPQDGKVHTWALGRASAEAAIAAVARGELVAVTDDESRENEGDLIMAAELCTPETMAFVVRHTGGVICAALPAERLEALALPQMLSQNQDPKGTAFTVTVDAASHWGVSTGISAADRAATMRALSAATSGPEDFVRPGHVFPLRAKAGGVLERDGHTEATVDLCRLAGLQPAGLLSELVTADSVGMARMPEIVDFCAEHQLVLTTIEDLICYRLAEGL